MVTNRRAAVPLPIPPVGDIESEAEAEPDDGLRMIAFQAALTEQETAAWLLAVGHGRTRREIARELEVASNTVRCYLSRANAKVRALIEELAAGERLAEDVEADIGTVLQRAEQRWRAARK